MNPSLNIIFYKNENCIILYLIKNESRRELTVGYNLNYWVRSALFNKKQLLELSVTVSNYEDKYAYFINADEYIQFTVGLNLSHETTNIPSNSYNASRISYDIFKRILEGNVFTVGIVESDIHNELFDFNTKKKWISIKDIETEKFQDKNKK
ncbi:hypothetical protein [Flavobacterium aciduliphilum]|uniref:hypothetical protein n=1 Tax=Flavobacterium aciduliphilum TaxID=1101402 RepID=UPI0011BFE393|nr:hypothetical protein [Flavobacterium aciduliphilum]